MHDGRYTNGLVSTSASDFVKGVIIGVTVDVSVAYQVDDVVSSVGQSLVKVYTLYMETIVVMYSPFLSVGVAFFPSNSVFSFTGVTDGLNEGLSPEVVEVSNEAVSNGS